MITLRIGAVVLVAASVLGVPAASATTPAPVPKPTPHVITGDSCPDTALPNTLRDGSAQHGVKALCEKAVAGAPTPQAVRGIRAAFHMLGAPYACGGVGRDSAFRFDCSSLVSRAYFLGAGIEAAGPGWSSSTRDMVPWDHTPLGQWASYISPKSLKPGDLVLYDTGGDTYRHVVMYLGSGFMLHTNSCGDVAHVSAFWGFPTTGTHRFLIARRVIAPGDTRVVGPIVPTRVPLAPLPPRTLSMKRLLAVDPVSVKLVQRSLNSILGIGLVVDGRWGPRTQAGFNTFRRQIVGLKGTAATGPVTSAAIVRLAKIAGLKVIA